VLPVSMLLLAGILVASDFRDYDDTPEGAPLRPLTRIAVVVAALVLMAVIAIPLAASSLVRQSQDEASEGDVAAALSDARSAQNVEPFAATPRLQEALVLEEAGALTPAAAAARAATERESTNWRTWVVLSRIEARRGRAVPAVVAYRKARALNPRSELFKR